MNILITGGTGSFGQALVKYLLTKELYDKIVIYSRDEHKQEQMREKFKSDKLRFLIGDVRDKDRLKLSVDDAHHIVHTAALKIVPSAEYNPFEYVKTNILGSQNLIDCCINHTLVNVGGGASTYPKVIALSTDKAVSPLNLYGSTKLTMEKLFIAANNIKGEYGPKFSVVRYGNVAGSNGSVIPLFKRMKELGAPMPITDIRMSRFWITLEEAVEFTMNSLAKMQGGETFIPDMPSFKVIDLAKCFSDKITEIGIRPGEKLHEEIEIGRSSDNNDAWLSEIDIRKQLLGMGAIDNGMCNLATDPRFIRE